MKKITIIILIYFSFFTSMAFSKMKKVSTNTTGTSFYVDFGSIKKKSGYIYYWGLTDYDKVQSTGHRSLKYFYELDCDLMRYKFLTDHAYTGHMGNGELTINNTPDKEWRYLVPESAGYEQSKRVCDYKN